MEETASARGEGGAVATRGVERKREMQKRSKGIKSDGGRQREGETEADRETALFTVD